MQEIRVSHAVVIDESGKLYLDQNERLKGLTLLGGKYEEGEDDLICLNRELRQEADFGIADTLSETIIRIDEILEIDGKVFNGVTRAIKIPNKLGYRIVQKKSNVVRMRAPEVLFRRKEFSKKINYKALVDKIIDSINITHR